MLLRMRWLSAWRHRSPVNERMDIEAALRAAFRAGAEFGATFRAQSEREEAVGLLMVRAITDNPAFMARALGSVREQLTVAAAAAAESNNTAA